MRRANSPNAIGVNQCFFPGIYPEISGYGDLAEDFSGYETGNFGNPTRKSVQISEINVKTIAIFCL